MDELNLKLYENIKKIMDEKKITSDKIAELLDESPPNICKKLKALSNGKSITTSSLYKFAKVLEVHPADLLK